MESLKNDDFFTPPCFWHEWPLFWLYFLQELGFDPMFDFLCAFAARE